MILCENPPINPGEKGGECPTDFNIHYSLFLCSILFRLFIISQPKLKRAPNTLLAFHPKRSAVAGDDLVRNVKTDAEAGIGLFAFSLDTVETFEDLLPLSKDDR